MVSPGNSPNMSPLDNFRVQVMPRERNLSLHKLQRAECLYKPQDSYETSSHWISFAIAIHQQTQFLLYLSCCRAVASFDVVPIADTKLTIKFPRWRCWRFTFKKYGIDSIKLFSHSKHCYRPLTTFIKSAFEPSGPSGRSLSQFL